MGLTDKKWFIDLQLSEGDFSSCPAESDPLVWALDNNLLSEEKYTEWASSHYLLPAVKKEFFSMAVDQYLCEKYQDIYDWNESFFPIYEWESLLYVSCIEPQEWSNAKDVCQIIAPRSAMKLLWNKIQPAKETQAPPLVKEEPLPLPEQPQEEKAPKEATASLDFSALGDVSLPELPTEEVPPTPAMNSEDALQSLSFDNLGPSAEDVPPPPIDDDSTPLPEIPLSKTAETETLAPPPIPLEAEPSSKTSLPETPSVPVPEPKVASEAGTPFNPQTNKPSIPVPTAPASEKPEQLSIPKEHLINESDLSKVKELGQCKDVSQVVMHIFSHIHKDFEKLMWISKKKDKIFQPDLVYGAWTMANDSWSTPVEIEKPNIFRIAWNSRMPFHGKVSNNATNQSYFDQWNDGHIPDHMTIFPLLTGSNQCEGFIVGLGHGDKFDNHHSYKKLENLLSLSHKQLSTQSQKAG